MHIDYIALHTSTHIYYMYMPAENTFIFSNTDGIQKR